MESTDYVDITPKGVDEKGRGASGIRGKVTFPETDIKNIVNNPGRLTKEGCKKKIELWNNSGNAYNKIKYQIMLQQCKTFAPTGKNSEGFIIYSRDKNGDPNWIEDKPLKDKR